MLAVNLYWLGNFHIELYDNHAIFTCQILGYVDILEGQGHSFFFMIQLSVYISISTP